MAVDVGIVVGNSGVLTPGDLDVYERLADLGYTVTIVDDSAAVPAGKQGFVICDSVTAATVGTKYDTLTVPVVTLRFDLWTTNRLAANTGAATAASVLIDLVSHAITTGLADPLTALTSAQAQRGVLNADLPAGAQVFARPGADATRVMGWAVPSGGTLTSGTAQARRVALYLPDGWPAVYTVGAVDLFEAVMTWAFRPFSLTYDPVLSRVRLSTDGLGGALNAVVERSTDQVVWTPVRGGNPAVVINGALALDDYEFTPNVANYYRVTNARDMHAAGVGFAGAAATANNASVSPAQPTAARARHTVLLLAAIRSPTATVGAAPAGYTTLHTAANVKLMGKTHSGTEAAPTVTFVGGAAGDDTIAQVAVLRNVQLVVTRAASQANASAQDVAYPALSPTLARQVIIYYAQKGDDWTSVATIPGATEFGDASSTTGNDIGMAWDFTQQYAAAPFDVPAGSFVVTGGAAAVSRGGVVALAPTTLVQAGSVTPTISTVWIKNLTRPFLNREVTVVGHGDVEMPDRNGVFDVVGRSYPVAVTDVRGARRQELVLKYDTAADAEEFRLCLSGGDPVFVQVPPTCPFPGMYAVVGVVRMTRKSQRGVRRYLSLPLTEVAAPAADLIGATVTYQSVLSSYASYTALAAAEASYAAVLEGIGAPADVIVP
jgi:hypothetical protein